MEIKIKINGKTVQTSILQHDRLKKTLYVKINGSCYKAKIIKQTHTHTTLYIENFKKQFTIVIKKKKIIPARLATPQSSKKSEDVISSPLAGKVIKVNVTPNQFVTKNQTLVIIESMKMENEIRATSNSFIKTIFIKESDLVQQGQLLITFEKRGDVNAKSKNKDEQKTI